MRYGSGNGRRTCRDEIYRTVITGHDMLFAGGVHIHHDVIRSVTALGNRYLAPLERHVGTLAEFVEDPYEGLLHGTCTRRFAIRELICARHQTLCPRFGIEIPYHRMARTAVGRPVYSLERHVGQLGVVTHRAVLLLAEIPGPENVVEGDVEVAYRFRYLARIELQESVIDTGESTVGGRQVELHAVVILLVGGNPDGPARNGRLAFETRFGIFAAAPATVVPEPGIHGSQCEGLRGCLLFGRNGRIDAGRDDGVVRIGADVVEQLYAGTHARSLLHECQVITLESALQNRIDPLAAVERCVENLSYLNRLLIGPVDRTFVGKRQLIAVVKDERAFEPVAPGRMSNMHHTALPIDLHLHAGQMVGAPYE